MATSGLRCGKDMRQLWRIYGSWPRFVKRGGLEVLQYFPAHGREGEAAPLLRRNLLILLVQVAILMASRTLAKNRFSRQNLYAPERTHRWDGGRRACSAPSCDDRTPHSPRYPATGRRLRAPRPDAGRDRTYDYRRVGPDGDETGSN